MKKLVTKIAFALTATIVLAGPAAASALLGANDNPVEIKPVETRVGWLAVLGDDVPAKTGKKTKKATNAKTTRKLIAFESKYKAGTIIVDNSERRLYHVLGDGLAMQYAVAVGRDGFRWTGAHKISAKAEWPAWNPPEEMRIREAAKGHVLPARMEGGKDNPLGARALYLGQSEFRIHGTNQPNSIGKFASSGCIRMVNADVEHLYAQAAVGATVIVQD